MSLIHEAVDVEVDYSIIKQRHSKNDYSLDMDLKSQGFNASLEIFYDPRVDYINKNNYAGLNLQDTQNVSFITALDTKLELFNSQIKKQRKNADMYMVNTIGITNLQYYMYLKDKYSKRNDLNTEVVSEMVETEIDYSKITYTLKEVNDAISWSRDTGKIIIIPSTSYNDLQKMLYNFNSMILKHRRESDWMSLYLFGLTNYQHFNYLISKVDDKESDINTLDDTIRESAPIHFYDSSRFFSNYMTKYFDSPIDEMVHTISRYTESTTSPSELRLIDKLTEDVFNHREDAFEVTSSFLPYSDMPFFSPEEMSDFGVYSSIDTSNYFGTMADFTVLEDDTSTADWFEEYKLNFAGIPTAKTKSRNLSWLNTMRRLYLDFDEIKESGDTTRINARMQSILELGWNPYIDFNTNNRVSAKYRLESIIESKANTYKFVDSRISEDEDTSITEAISIEETVLKPVYIVFVGAKTIFADTVKKATNSRFSHAGISLDSNMESIYSFGIDSLVRTDNKLDVGGGLTKESISKYKPDTTVSIFGFFVKEKDYNLIQQNINWFLERAKETRYSYKGLLAYLFKIPMVENTKLICSQFVDRILKLSNIDLSGISSAFVSPADLNVKVKSNSKIYHFFDGIASGFKARNLKGKIHRIANKATPIKEADLAKLNINATSLITKEINSIYSGIEPIINEARTTPIDFDDDGNLLIRGDIFKIDFAAEYSKSHKILMAADQAKSYETMKHEVAKLWMMNTIIEKKLHDKNISKDRRLELNTNRAHILNDFKKYVEIIMKKEPGFNFSQYYEDSQFNNATTKVSKNVLKYTALTLKRILSSDLLNIVPITFIH